MSLSHVGTNDKDHLRLVKVGEGIGHRAGSEGCRQTGDSRRVSGTGAVIDVVRADHRSKQLLHLIGILVDAAGATDSPYGIWAVLGDDILEFGNNQVEGLIPGGLTESVVLS